MTNSPNNYFSTFASGFEPIIEDLLKQSLNHVKTELLLDGLVVYSADSSIEEVKKIKFFTNSFLLLRYFPNNKAITVEKMMAVVSKDGIRLAQRLPPNLKTFRVVTSKENQPVPVNQRLMIDMEKQINKSLGLKPDRSSPQIQFWFLTRSEGYGFFGIRLTRHPDYAKVLEKGELRPEITNILCLLSEPKKSDIFLDPFAGLGAIALARADFPFTQIYAGDINPKNKHIQKMDATKLNDFDNESIDKIVTDPPWGFFGQKLDLTDLYTKTLNSFYRVLKTGGVLVILVGDRPFFEKLLKNFEDKFMLKQKLYILVSGKKAGVYKLVKK